MSIGNFVIGVVVGIVVTKVGLEKVIGIVKQAVTEAIPVLLGVV